MTVQEVYEHSIRGLPAADRLQLATLILNEISPLSIVDVSDEWSEEDLRDFSLARRGTISRAGWEKRKMLRPGDVVTVDFVGATGTKRRPCVVVSSSAYHSQRLDVILGVLTTNVTSASGVGDYLLQDHLASGLRSPSAFRSYFGMYSPKQARIVGHLTPRDWDGVLKSIARSFGLPEPTSPAVASP